MRAAEALRLPLVEADVHLFAGRLEVRHRKTVGPITSLWDRWELAPPWAPRLLLDAATPGTELMLDVKGHDRRLPDRVLAAVAAAGPPGRLTVCSQDWRLLEPLAVHPGIRVVHSVGNARQPSRLWRREDALAGVSIHERLLDAAVVQELRRRAALILLGKLPLLLGGATAVAVLFALAARWLRPALRRLWAAAQQGGTILRTPGR